jgi:hypothetical protein
MGLYSTVSAEVQCQTCGWHGEAKIQFHYGNLYDNEYVVGSPIVWGRTQVGESGHAKVVAEGVGECPHCGADLDFDVFVEHDIITSVQASSGKYDYFQAGGDYVVLEE